MLDAGLITNRDIYSVVAFARRIRRVVNYERRAHVGATYSANARAAADRCLQGILLTFEWPK